MARYRTGVLSWDLQELASALRLTPDETRLYFTDGRRISFILERRLSNEVIKGTLAPSEGAGFDLLDEHGGKWEVRSITRSGIYFCPSYMVGSGRTFNVGGFLAKLGDVAGYIVSDIEQFPNIPWWVIPANDVKIWWDRRLLGATTKISRTTALALCSGQIR